LAAHPLGGARVRLLARVGQDPRAERAVYAGRERPAARCAAGWPAARRRAAATRRALARNPSRSRLNARTILRSLGKKVPGLTGTRRPADRAVVVRHLWLPPPGVRRDLCATPSSLLPGPRRRHQARRCRSRIRWSLLHATSRLGFTAPREIPRKPPSTATLPDTPGERQWRSAIIFLGTSDYVILASHPVRVRDLRLHEQPAPDALHSRQSPRHGLDG